MHKRDDNQCHSEKDSEQQTFNAKLQDTLSAVRKEEPATPVFENYLKELLGSNPDAALSDKPSRLVEKFVQSILDRISVPHIHENAISKEDFFKHLSDYAQHLAEQENTNLTLIEKIDVDIFIGGGVVRSMLANLYKFVYERKQETKVTEYSTETDFDLKQAQRKKQMLESTEFHMVQSILAEKSKIPSPFVLGVGSDLDIYYEIKPKGVKMEEDTPKLSVAQIDAGKRIKSKLEIYVNQLESQHGLREETSPLKHSILPIADVKEYHQQLTRSLQQGGSLLDALAFKLVPNDKDRSFHLRHPKGYPKILKDFLEGFYEYLSPPDSDVQPTQKTTVRGLRVLLEIPFVSPKDPQPLMTELQTLLTHETSLEEDSKKQFDKMIRNSHFQGAFNRAYRETQKGGGTPLSLGLQIAEMVYRTQSKSGASENVRFLLPAFLQKMPILNPDITLDGKHVEILESALVSYDDFIENQTDKGLVFHGTSALAGLCVLRGGFILSTEKQGAAMYGPAVYAAKTHDEAAQFLNADQGMMLPLRISTQEDIKVLDWNNLSDESKKKLNQEAKEKGFEHEFDLLRDRKEYGVDIVLNGSYVLIQNQSAIELGNSLEEMLDWLQGFVFFAKNKLDKCLESCSNVRYSKKALKSALMRVGKATASYDAFYRIVQSVGGVIQDKPTSLKLLLDALEGKQSSDVVKLSFCLLMQAKYLFEGVDDPSMAEIKTLLDKMIQEFDAQVVRKAFLLVAKFCPWEHLKVLANSRKEVLNDKDRNIDMIILAIILERADVVKAIVQAKPELVEHVITEEGYAKGETVLTWAIYKDRIDVVKAIIQAKPELVEYVITEGYLKGRTAFTWAVSLSRTEIVKAIIKAKPETVPHVITDGYTVFTRAVGRGDIEIVKAFVQVKPELLEYVITEGSETKGHTMLTWAVNHSQSETVEYIIKAKPELVGRVITEGPAKGHTALTWAVYFDPRREIIEIIIKAKPELLGHVITEGPAKGHTALTWTICKDRVDVAKAIIKAKPELVGHVITEGEARDHTVLTWAACLGRIEIAKAIIKAKSETVKYVITEGPAKGHTALTQAICHGQAEFAKAIIKAKPETVKHVITEGDDKGHNMLTWAIIYAQSEIAKKIINFNPQTIDHVIISDREANGMTPRILAEKVGMQDILEFIDSKTPKVKKCLRFSGEKEIKSAARDFADTTPKEEPCQSPDKGGTGTSKNRS